MKKRTVLSCLSGVLLAAILFVPIPIGPAKDGGTRQYSALTYKVVVWNRFTDELDENGQPIKYQNTSVFWFPDNQKSIEQLWEIEIANRRYAG